MYVNVYTANKAQRLRCFGAIFELLSGHLNVERLLECSRLLWRFLSTFTEDLFSSLIDDAFHKDWLVECFGTVRRTKKSCLSLRQFADEQAQSS